MGTHPTGKIVGVGTFMEMGTHPEQHIMWRGKLKCLHVAVLSHTLASKEMKRGLVFTLMALATRQVAAY